jgi:hypothetical protein
MEKRTIIIGLSLLAVVGLGFLYHKKGSSGAVVQNNKSKPSPPTIVNTPSGAVIELGATDSDKAYILDLKKQGYTDQQIGVMYAKRKGLIK